MNEIITKLNEIEEKAETILSDAKSKKEQMTMQVELDKKAIDEKYDKIELESAEEFRKELKLRTKAQLEKQNQQMKQALEQLEENFTNQKESMAQEIFSRIVS